MAVASKITDAFQDCRSSAAERVSKYGEGGGGRGDAAFAKMCNYRAGIWDFPPRELLKIPMVECSLPDFVTVAFNQNSSNLYLANNHKLSRWGKMQDVVVRMPSGYRNGCRTFQLPIE